MRYLLLLGLTCALAGAVPSVAGSSDDPPAPIVVQPGDTSHDGLPDDGPAPATAAPSVLQPPRGTAIVGARLTVPAPFVGSVHYQWQSCKGTHCANLRGATKSTFVLTAKLIGKTVRVAATTDAGVHLVSKPSTTVRAKH